MAQSIHNPFADESGTAASDEELVEQSKAGEREALEELLRRHQAWVYNIALRMVWEPQDAEEVTQEVLLKVITRLGSFEGRSKFRTWLYRIVCNHVLNMKQGRLEPADLTFKQYGEQLDAAPDLDLPDPNAVPVELPLLVEEARIGCTMGMLLCLDRRQRLVYVLGEILGISSEIGAEVLDLSSANFRQILSRARRDLGEFMNEKCGLVREENPCRCRNKTRAFMNQGYVDPEHMRFAEGHTLRVAHVVQHQRGGLDELIESATTAIYREQPFPEAPDQVSLLRALLSSPQARGVLAME